MKSVLVHCCCAYTVSYWRQRGYEPSGFWYNPNIHPYSEHQHRLGAIKSLAKEKAFALIVAEDYGMMDYFRRVSGHEAERCRHCFHLRLLKTADTAQGFCFDAFTTSLLISPHQRHELLPGIGNRLAEERGIPFLYADLRKRYSDSRLITKPLNLYRQQYCGCVCSQWERYAGIKIE